MLEGFQKHSQSLFLVVLVASVATMFGVSRGPQQGCSQSSLKVSYAARVYGHTLSDSDFVAATNTISGLIPAMMADNPAVTGAVRQGALDGLIERELLAHEAERLGMRVTEAQVSEAFRQCHFYATVGVGAESTLGLPSGRLPLPANFCGGAGDQFDYAVFERTVRRFFRRSVGDLRAATEREMLADRMRQTIRASVQVSDEEIWREYQRTHDQMAVKYLRFNLAFYRTLVRDDDAQALAAWMAAHEREVNEQYTRRRDALRGLARELRLRHIRLPFPDNATDAQKAEVRARAEAIVARLSGGEDFIRLARLYSEDDTWRAGGDLGWRNYASETGYNHDIAAAAAGLQRGGVSPVVVTSDAVAIVQLVDVREGDVPEADAKRDLARAMFRDGAAVEMAQAAANAALGRVRGGASIDDVGREVNAASLRAFYRGEVPGPQAVRADVNLVPVERSDLGAPAMVESELFSRTGMVAADLEDSASLVRAAFALTDAQPLVTAPLRAGDDFFVLRYKDGSRTLATREEFARQRQELLTTTYASMLAAKQREAVVLYLSRLRQDAEHEGQVRIGDSPRLRAPQNNNEEGE